MALAPGHELLLQIRVCRATPLVRSCRLEFLCPTPKVASHSRWQLRSHIGIYFLWERRSWEKSGRASQWRQGEEDPQCSGLGGGGRPSGQRLIFPGHF